jgi:hypothetical protein
VPSESEIERGAGNFLAQNMLTKDLRAKLNVKCGDNLSQQTRSRIMYESMNITPERVASFDTDVGIEDLQLGNSRLGLGVILTMAAFVGIWGVACLIGGLASAGNFNEVWRSLITAFTGM